MIAAGRELQRDGAVVDIVVPVHNEEAVLEGSIRRLHAYLCDRFPLPARVTIVDNASTDRTWAVAWAVAAELPSVRAFHLHRKGRGGAVAAAWLESDARVLAYMDLDLSTDLNALLPLVAPLLSGHSDVSIGSRLARGAHVVRGPRREIISRCYNLLLKLVLGVGFGDAQCGFKAIRDDVARRLLPLVEDRRWFFDTELLVLAERAGFRIHEIPVDWVDDPDSSVNILLTALQDLRGVARLALRPCDVGAVESGRIPRSKPAGLLRQVGSFGVIGVLSTAAYSGLYWLLCAAFPATAANVVALLVTACANTAANRRFTFGVRGRSGAAGDQLGGLLALSIALLTTNLSIATLRLADPQASRGTELIVLAMANAVATLARFVLLRLLIFERRQQRRRQAASTHAVKP